MGNRALVILLSISILLFGCEKFEFNGYKTFYIKKGRHSSTVGVQFLRQDGVTFYAKFDESAIYQSKDPVNQYDINKLYGFSECNDLHHDNSARFGWRWLNGNLEILGYVYNQGVVSYELIDTIGINEEHYYELNMRDSLYEFKLDDKTMYMNRTSDCATGVYYKLYPYFGGDEKAPHDIEIEIKEKFK